MRFDPKIRSELNLTSRQQLFGEVWFNQVHEYSLDAFRVRTMNPVSIVEELLESFVGDQFKSPDRTRIVSEALELLETSILVQRPPFKVVADELVHVLKEWVKNNKDKGGEIIALIETFGRELLAILKSEYLGACMQWLTSELEAAATPMPDPLIGDIEQVTGQLLSCLISTGWSFESLFHLYRTAFSPDSQHTPKESPYEFLRGLAWLFNRLGCAPKPYRITFAINQFTNCEEIPNNVGDIEFSQTPPQVPDSCGASVQRLAKAGPNRLFATMTVKANDSRIAGMQAAEHIEQVLDVVRYDFIRQNFSLSERFLVGKEDGHYITLEVSKTVPNEKREVTSTQLHDFMQQLNNLVASGTLEDDAKDRIYSAFRLYRIGAESVNLENKLVNWWTALEFLVKAGGGNIGDAVEKALFPTVILSDLTKHLNAVRSALVEFGAPLSLADGSNVDLSQVATVDLYRHCQDQTFKGQALAAAARNPFAKLYLTSFFIKVESPAALLTALNKHELEVRWQIQRIYRARCDIVHSAKRIIQAPLLCANLESYLKNLLDTFLKSLQNVTTMRSPKEFFDRQNHAVERLKAQLSKGQDSILMEVLSRHDT